MEQGEAAQAREHFADSIRLSQVTGSRIGIARGLEAFAALDLRGGHGERALQLIAAAAALRTAAHLPALAGARTERYFAAVSDIGELAIRRLWHSGFGLTSDSAIAMALESPGTAAEGGPGDARRGRTAGPGGREAASPPGRLTAREREIVALIVQGHSNKAIADALFISPATAARHVANILEKLGFNSRAQIAAWAAANDTQRWA
jgi:DNA-binding CsgD family transcriptional regulator